MEPKPLLHGKYFTYLNGCRCDLCVDIPKKRLERNNELRRWKRKNVKECLSKGVPVDGAPIVHGTINGYRRGCLCVLCKEEGSKEYRAHRKIRGSKPKKEIPHNLNGYRNYKCRCDVCKEAHSKDMKEYKARKRLQNQ